MTAYKKGFMGTEAMIGVQAKRTATNIWNEAVKPALEKVKGEIDIKDVFSSMRDKIESEIKEKIRKTDLMAQVDEMEKAYKDTPTMSHQMAQDIKSDLYKFIPEKWYNGKPVASISTEIKGRFASELRKRTRQALKDNTEALQAFDDYGNLKALSEFGINAISGSKKKGGFGSFVSSLYENATVPAKTVGGQVLKKTGEALQKIKK